jgi:ribosome-associated toxin RatA of RatAB toxin-antitoxin module
MTRLQHAVVIERPLPDVYALARQVERYPEFLPGYLESRILRYEGDRALLQRKACVSGELKEWKSWVFFQENQAITFEHAEGPLTGMRVYWQFKALSPHQTELVIVHLFEIHQPAGFGWFNEKFVYKPKIDALAATVIQAFKKVCEQQAYAAL